MLQWGHGDEAVEDVGLAVGNPAATIRFNGATAMKPWKTPSRRFNIAGLRSLQWGHGDEAVEDDDDSQRSISRATRFNGATAMKPWKTG